MAEKIIIVDENDSQIGIEDKEKCHDGEGILHRAFIVIVVNDSKQVLLIKRSGQKRLWPNYWEMSIASHVREKETYQTAAERRLKEELGIEGKAEYKFKFRYKAEFREKGSENEICAVLTCKHNGLIKPTKEEISETKLIDFKELQKSMGKDCAPWMKIALEKINKDKINIFK